MMEGGEIKILIAGMGNKLRCDDGFGIEVVRLLREQNSLPAGAHLLEVGIAGISLVQELFDAYDACIIVDAVDLGGQPGKIYCLQPQIPDPHDFEPDQQRAYLSDTHYTVPIKALAMAKALKVLPPQVFIIGCQPLTCDDLNLSLSEPVARSLVPTIELINRTIEGLMVSGSSV